MTSATDLPGTMPSQTQGVKYEQVETFTVAVVAGPDAGATVRSNHGRVLVGRDESARLRLSDPTASQFHLELEVEGGGVRARDLGSSTGTVHQTLGVRDVIVRGAAEFTLGGTRVRVTPGDQPETVITSAADHFHGMIGAARSMRAVYARLQSAALTTSTVLILGESGTGKELAARALHDASSRQAGRFEVVNCGELVPTLTESELFGHARGSFIGAHRDTEGAFERADGGTIFLDEVGELPLESQPKLLRVLETGQVQRVGSDRVRTVNVRVVAATNRDLRAEVNAGRFRADLYYRLAVIMVRIPPLRERTEDLARLSQALIAQLRRDRGIVHELPVDDALLATLRVRQWPGNVRELRNYLEQWLVLNQQPDASEDVPAGLAVPSDLLFDRPLAAARDSFERAYLAALLERHQWQIVEAARAAGVDRATLFRTIQRLQIERPK